MLIDRKLLSDALARLVPIAAKGMAQPILSGVLIAPMQGSVKIQASNLEQHLSVTLPCETKDSEPFVIEAKRLFAAIKASAADDVRIHAKDSQVRVQIGNSRYKMQTLGDWQGFPKPPDLTDPVTLETSGMDLIHALQAVINCVAVQDVRYYLHGVHVIAAPGSACVVEASDGSMLARRTIPCTINGILSAIIPSGVVQTIIRSGRPDIVIHATSSTAQITLGDYQLTAQLIAGIYPDVARVIPRDHPHKMSVNRQELLHALSAVQVIESSHHALRMVIKPGQVLILEAQDIDGQVAKTPVETRDAIDQEMLIGINSKMLRTILMSMDAETIEIQYKDPDSAVLITPETYVLMPVRM